MEPNNAPWVKLVQTQHPAKLLPFARHMNEPTIAAIYGIDTETYRSIQRQLSETVRDAAADMLEQPDFAAKVDRLPFRPGQTVVAIGESTTDDLLSWFELLRHLVQLRRPEDEIRFVNEGVSGFTTSQVLGRMSGIAAKEPDWLFCMIGGNDAMRIGPDSGITQVSPGETARNMAAIRQLAAARTNARLVWLTPSSIDEQRAADYPPFKAAGLAWRNEDIRRAGDIIRELPDPVADTQDGFLSPGADILLGPDGVHPTLEGHRYIVTVLVEELAK
ncbi:SGNH/GDSL hydrolase family protein [Paenibacillus ginsengarvi]|uniref:SGNH hydrolase-type esterase domain-containing protein n=1 Tax=Paenibacillus ginsengarvi TaxID=400777 RepID=A0A3B0CJB9_9BACL|nr:GDSL-type esterase/lipase family protein [Paenibacillus ginsengarvi]RKN84379.1 hypothetical protein D7M11_12865 [Paenibacillus ginsengarvi]